MTAPRPARPPRRARAKPTAVPRANAVRFDADTVAAMRAALLAHFDAHQRDLPWRRTRDPYAIWVSEVMLQQTRVETVVPYYQRFVQRFPTPQALADAPIEHVLALWSGLGYYRRARLLHQGARAVVDQHGGRVPATAEVLRTLPGVGEYTAGAIASIAFAQRAAVVDGNVERVLSRLFALRGDPRAAAGRARLWTLARAFADSERPGDVNQALMELGATVCAPVSPRCLLCPARALCAARAQGAPEEFPEKAARARVRTEAWQALVALDRAGEHVWLVPSEVGRWQGMLLPPMAARGGAGGRVKGATPAKKPAGAALLAALDAAELAHIGLRRAGAVRHVLTHAVMDVAVYRATLTAAPPRGRMVALRALDELPVPKVTRALLAEAGAMAR
jgi:A/G-specific adenine glycosylase